MWCATSGQDEVEPYRKMWVMAVDESIESMSGHSAPSGLAYIGEKSEHGAGVSARMEHLACFFPGRPRRTPADIVADPGFTVQRGL